MKSTGKLFLCSLYIRESLKMTKIQSCVYCLLNTNHHELENPHDLYKPTVLFCLVPHAVMKEQLRQRTKELFMNLRTAGNIKRDEGRNGGEK